MANISCLCKLIIGVLNEKLGLDFMALTKAPDSEDFFADTRMSFGDHIEDLRSHLINAFKGFFVAFIFSFLIGKYVVDFITLPVKSELKKFYERRVSSLREELDKGTDSTLIALNKPTEFTGLIFSRAQLEALFKGDPSQAISEIKPPADLSEEKLKNETVTLWVSHKEPLKESALMGESQRKIGDFDAMSTLSVQEAFMVYFKVCIVCGIVIGSPWLFFQAWSFVAVGLYPHEKKLVHVYLPFSVVLFLSGVFICEFFVIPKAIEALLWFNEWLGLKPDLRLNEWLSFAIFMPVVFGLSFQTPLVMIFTERLGIINVEMFQKNRKYAWFFMAIFAAVATPSTDAFSMLFLWIPMSLLYELGIFMCKISPSRPDYGIDVPEPDEMVGV